MPPICSHDDTVGIRGPSIDLETLSVGFSSQHDAAAEKTRLLHLSLTSGYQDWCERLQRAAAERNGHRQNASPLDAQDLLAFVSRPEHITTFSPPGPQSPLAETDRLLHVLAGSLDVDIPALGHGLELQAPKPEHAGARASAGRKHRKRVLKSPFWGSAAEADGADRLHASDEHQLRLQTSPLHGAPADDRQSSISFSAKATEATHENLVHGADDINALLVKPLLPKQWAVLHPATANEPKPRSPAKSPFFAPTTPETSPSKKRSLAGIVSAIPFPPLDAPCFSLVQEKLCHEPFWLLVAVTFLIKTAGKLAIPTFYKVRARFPTPELLADPTNGAVLMDMIRHLGLCVNRTAMIQKYAQGWVTNPPRAGKVFRVRGYDIRENVSSDMTSKDDAGDAWEIGHLTQGKYALDSWRIFCRDELLGHAQDWNGMGAAPEFQPEWMRVRPSDKELRACLRWMWMKEGWEWDPETGERIPLRPEMAAAVNEGRVEYDDTGGLRILDSPRPESQA